MAVLITTNDIETLVDLKLRIDAATEVLLAPTSGILQSTSRTEGNIPLRIKLFVITEGENKVIPNTIAMLKEAEAKLRLAKVDPKKLVILLSEIISINASKVDLFTLMSDAGLQATYILING